MQLTLVDNLVMPEEGDLSLLDVHPHLGLLALAAAAEAHGHSVRIYDPKWLLRCGTLRYDDTLYERAAAAILSQRPEAVGFTSLGCSFLFAINVAALLRQQEPELPIMLGGPHATMLDRLILERFPQFDLIVRHEADEIFPAVLRALPERHFISVPGLSWRDRRGEFQMTPGKPKVEDLDRLPLLSYDHYPIAELGLDLLRIEAGRGCPFMCTFCSTAGFFQRSFRLKSAERLVFELEQLRERYGYSEFKLDHDMFTVNKRKVMEFCEAVKGRGFRWRVSARVDCVNPMLLEKMAEAGCIGLYFGIETGSKRMQQITMKKLDLDLVEPTLAIAAQLGIETTASFITGYPEEHRADQDDTLDMIGRCFTPNCLTQLHILQPEPGTPMYAEHSAEIRYDGYSSPYNTYLLTAQDRDLVTGTPDIFQTYFHYPAVLPREDHTFAVLTVELLRRVGATVVGYTLRRFEGRLSSFVAAFRAFAARKTPRLSPARRPDGTLLADFIAERFGPHHYLTSVFRLGLALHDMSTVPGHDTPAVSAPTFSPQQTFVLSERVRILPDLHDCENWLSRIRNCTDSADILEGDDDEERFTYVLHFGQAKPASYRVDNGIGVILGLFNQPQRCDSVSEMIRAIAGGTPMDPNFFRELVETGILVEPPHPLSILA
ncbi:B12-binding domain-containing radical SAM protein [Dyella tabacisoli]|uniref:Radical SAM protein n=1 Tax=Dyella tabacisoli TaxID=2282381 RepID=A0A369URB3_9GAMM|nr:radical SAM protein [Dyella tabacisoli]RDD82170.1 radical SAM protein [Dyella tabacisoli]